MRHAGRALLLALTLSGCASPYDQAEQLVRDQMKDPGATQFRKERFCGEEGKSIIAGEYNGKNSYGGYDGFKSFYVEGTSVGLEGDDGEWLRLIRRCTAQIKAGIVPIPSS